VTTNLKEAVSINKDRQKSLGLNWLI